MMLGQAGLRVTSSLELDRVLGEITRALVRELDAALARVWLVRREDGDDHLRLVASAGLSERLDGSRSRVPIGDLKIGEIASTRQPVSTNDLANDPRFTDKEWIRENALTTFAGYPLTTPDHLVGVLAMFSRKPLSEGELEQLRAFAEQASIALENARVFERVAERSQRLEVENADFKSGSRETGVIGQSPAVTRVLAELGRVAKTNATVLLRGETGTGKELFARALHHMSPRRAEPLVKLNCGAIAPTLIESELFGHEKGAFTGATQRRLGRFELARGGTLFLDEVGELPLEAQTKLLRVLQEHEIERVGGGRPIRVDVRIVAATNRDLETAVREERFRADLFYRLNVFPLVIPPLRDRREDIPLLASEILHSLASQHGGEVKQVDDDAMAYLGAYDWPGNVRELMNVLERATILAPERVIGVVDLPELRARSEASTELSSEPSSESLKQRVDAFERSLIADALRRADGNQSEAARLLHTSRATLQYKMKLHRLP
jgi:transcriptional regulator with GAF, ATPase, and Fis domain